MSQNYKIVERLKAGRLPPPSYLGDQATPTQLELEVASLIQELGEALERLLLAVDSDDRAKSGYYIVARTKARYILSKLNEA